MRHHCVYHFTRVTRIQHYAHAADGRIHRHHCLRGRHRRRRRRLFVPHCAQVVPTLVVSCLWLLFTFSLTFGEGRMLIGNFKHALFVGVSTDTCTPVRVRSAV